MSEELGPIKTPLRSLKDEQYHMVHLVGNVHLNGPVSERRSDSRPQIKLTTLVNSWIYIVIDF